LSYIIFVSDYDVDVFPFFLFHSSVTSIYHWSVLCHGWVIRAL